MIIRDVQETDAAFILKAAKEFIDYYPANLGYDEPTLVKVLGDLSVQGVFLVAEKDGQVVGSVGAAVTQHIYNTNLRVGTELFLWVDEDSRNSTVGVRLLKEMEKQCISRDCKLITMTSTVHTPKFSKFLINKMNYLEGETSFYKEL